MPRVLHVTNIPNPYRIPQLNEIDRQLKVEGWELRVAFGSAGYDRRKWAVEMEDCRFGYSILSSEPLSLPGKARKRYVFTYPGLITELRNFKPDVVIVTGFSLATAKVSAFARFSKTPFIIFSGTIPRRAEQQWGGRLFFRRMMARQASGGIAYGSLAREYLSDLGIPKSKIEIAINTPDIDFFTRESRSVRESNGRRAAGLKLLSVGDLVSGKRIDLLLPVMQGLRAGGVSATLTVVGEGPERESLEKKTVEMGIQDRVEFVGFRPRAELPRFYARSDCFLFPSEIDIWGLVLNEAMASALACVVSRHPGAVQDLIDDGETGIIVDFRKTAEVVNVLGTMAADRQKAREIGRRALAAVHERASLAVSSAGFLRAIETARS